MEKGYNIELLEQKAGPYQKIRITIEGGVGSVILENRGVVEGLKFYREGDEPADESSFKKVELSNAEDT